MTKEQFLKNLLPPEGNVDVVLDTDTYNEVDDQFAIGWLLNKNGRYMHGRIENVKLPGYDGVYHDCEKEIPMCYVDRIYRNPLMGDLINKLIK